MLTSPRGQQAHNGAVPEGSRSSWTSVPVAKAEKLALTAVTLPGGPAGLNRQLGIAGSASRGTEAGIARGKVRYALVWPRMTAPAARSFVMTLAAGAISSHSGSR